jgi:hypothetical protein
LINPIRNLCSRNDELKRYLHLEGIALHALGDAGVDAGSLPLDTPLSALGEFTGVQGHARWAAEASGSAEPTIRDLAFVLEGANRVVGTADEIACYLEEWREAGVNGINVYVLQPPRTSLLANAARLRFRETYTTGRAPSDSARTPEDGCNW